MLHFNEDTRVKFPATIQFLRLGYNYQSLKDAEIDFETKIFINRFKPAIEKINNKQFTDKDVKAILNDINTAINEKDLGRDFYDWLTGKYQEKIKLIDFDNIDNNDFAVVDELPFGVKETTEEGSFRPDINILINGMPLAFLEVKKPNNEGGIQKEFDRMINQRLKNDAWRKYFNLIQIVSFSNNMEYEEADDDLAEDVKAGSFYSSPNGENTSFSFFREDEKDYHKTYKYLDIDEATIKNVVKDGGYNPAETDEPEFQTNLSPFTPCNRFVTSFYNQERFMYMLHYGLMYLTERKKIVNKTTNKVEELPIDQKHIMRYPQFFATRKTVERLVSGGHSGIIWHTQGSGKTALGAYSVPILREYYAKKGITARFFFIVDRLDLLTQASTEFTNRHFNVIKCNNKKELAEELNRPLAKTSSDSIGDICVANIQKIMEKSSMPVAKNDYDAKIQRVFFIDEAHRSYKMHGEFFKNLMTCDENGIYIALTGTPLLTKNERSNAKFGDYIHKYFYDKSIADGYTLRIKKENIDTLAKAEIKKNLQLEGKDLDDQAVYESDDYINALCPYIQKDFQYFRLTNNDNTIGGMIVCRSNAQAKMIHEWFVKNGEIKTGLVISDEGNAAQDQINKNNQIDFRENGYPDMLVVNYMLTTGYDVKRLKKMYLLRGPHAHSLLQTISRVNRPYSHDGKKYRYGYIVDFVDIAQEYNETLDAYIKELEDEMGDEEDAHLTGLVVDAEDVKKKLEGFYEELNDIPVFMDNKEKFARQTLGWNKDTLLRIRKLLRNINECDTEFALSRADEYRKLIDLDNIRAMIKTVQERIDFINLSTKPLDTLGILNNEDVVKILYEFIKTKIMILDLSKIACTKEEQDEFVEAVTRLQEEIKRNQIRKDIKMFELEQLLNDIFAKLQISNLADLSELTDELKEAIEKAKKINDENERLAKIYENHYAFAKAYNDAVMEKLADKTDIEEFLKLIYEEIKDRIDDDTLLVQGRKEFVDNIKENITITMLQNGLFKKLKDVYSDFLSSLYTDIQLYK